MGAPGSEAAPARSRADEFSRREHVSENQTKTSEARADGARTAAERPTGDGCHTRPGRLCRSLIAGRAALTAEARRSGEAGSRAAREHARDRRARDLDAMVAMPTIAVGSLGVGQPWLFGRSRGVAEVNSCWRHRAPTLTLIGLNHAHHHLAVQVVHHVSFPTNVPSAADTASSSTKPMAASFAGEHVVKSTLRTTRVWPAAKVGPRRCGSRDVGTTQTANSSSSSRRSLTSGRRRRRRGVAQQLLGHVALEPRRVGRLQQLGAILARARRERGEERLRVQRVEGAVVEVPAARARPGGATSSRTETSSASGSKRATSVRGG